jgi:hypothetical protein
MHDVIYGLQGQLIGDEISGNEEWEEKLNFRDEERNADGDGVSA